MVQDPIQVLQAATRPAPAGLALPRLLLAGATGVLGGEVLRQLAGGGRYAGIQVLVREPYTDGLRNVRSTVVAGDDPGQWPVAEADVAVVLFEPARMFHGRERALWTPRPDQLVPLARWLQASGVHTLAVVQPHDAGRLPEALKRGLADLDEQAVASLGFERLLLLRSARKPQAPAARSPATRLADWMLSIFKYMVPASEQPVRPVRVAQLLAAALELAPRGIHIAAPEVVWRAGQGQAREVAACWLTPP